MEASGCDHPRLDVVIVAYQSRETIQSTLENCSRIPALGDVVVVDNGSDGAGNVAEAAGAAVLYRPDNPGYGTGQNLGVSVGHGPFVLLLNPDATINVEALLSGVELLRSHPNVAAIQGVIRSRVSGEPERSGGRDVSAVHLWGRALHLRVLLKLPAVRTFARRVPLLADHVQRVPSRAVPVETLAATALLVRRSAFEAVGGFDARFFLYGEDLDLCRRLRDAKWDLLALPVEWAVHEGGASSAGPVDREIEWWRGTLYYLAQSASSASWLAARLAAALMAVRLCLKAPRRARRIGEAFVFEPRSARRRRTPSAGISPSG